MPGPVLGFFGRLADLYYRWERLGGEVPAHGPLVLVANHPNGLVDPLMVERVAGRRFRMLAKAPILSMPVIGRLARWAGAIPVHRRMDGAAAGQNEAAFAAARAVLERGEALFLFPEGISHNEPEVQPLKTGAARIALGAEAGRGFALGVRVVPIGIVYRDKTRFGSAAALEVGESIAVGAFGELYGRDERAAVAALTAAIEEGLRRVTVNLEHWEDVPRVRLAARILGGREHVVGRVRTVAEAARLREKEDPALVAALRERLDAFQRRLEQFGLRVDHLDARYPLPLVIRFVLRNLLALAIGLPVAAAVGILYLPPLILVRAAGRRWGGSEDILATVKFLAGLLFFPLWHALVVTAAWRVAGGAAAAAAGICLPFLYLFSRYYWRHRRAAWREARVFLSLPMQRRLRDRLRRERDELRAAFVEQAGPAELDV